MAKPKPERTYECEFCKRQFLSRHYRTYCSDKCRNICKKHIPLNKDVKSNRVMIKPLSITDKEMIADWLSSNKPKKLDRKINIHQQFLWSNQKVNL